MSDKNIQSTIIKADRLVNGLGEPVKTQQAILVLDGRISVVGPAPIIVKRAVPETEIVDLGSTCVAPGLIDCHTHLSLSGDGRNYVQMFSDTDEMMAVIGAMNLRRHLAAGITTIREHGARNRVGFTLKEGLERGYIAGPRLLACGRPITCTRGHFHMCNEVADGVEEIRRSVRRLVHEGADHIKIMASGGGTAGTIPGRASYSVAELRSAVHEAHHFHRLTAAHCRAKESMVRAVEAGIDLMEHAEFLDTDMQVRFDPKIAEMMAESGIWVSPTLQALTRYPRIVELAALRDQGALSADEESELNALEQNVELRLDTVRRMLDYGLKERIVPGSDSGVANLAFGHLDYDLQLLVRVGFTPAEAFRAATRVSAQAAGLDGDIGTIEPGKLADLVAFDGDPTTDVSAVSRVTAVVQAGRRVR